MSDVNTFIDTIGKDISAVAVPRLEDLAKQISETTCNQYGPRVSAFANQLVQDLINEQSATVRDFVAKLIQDVFQRYQPELGGELHTRIVQGAVEVTGRGVKLELKNRATGASVSSLDLPVSITIKVDAVGVTLQNATVNFNVV